MRSDGCVDEIETYIRRAASAIGSGVPEEEVQERFEKEGCPPAQARLYVVAGRQLYQQQEDSFFGGGRALEGEAAPFSRERAYEIGSALGVDWKKIPLEEFRVGLGVEMEHADVTGGDPLKTGRIVLAHLKEDREYYAKLKRAGLERGREEKGLKFVAAEGEKMFPILITYEERRKGYNGPRQMPWAMLQPHEEWALRNHDQDLKMLASRGGLGPDEALAILDERKWKLMPLNEAGVELQRRIDAFRSSGSGAAEDSECHVCQPFTKLVRDEKEFSNCMKLAEEIGELSDSKAMTKLIRGHMGRQDQEVFVAICLDFRGQLRDFVEIGRGQRHRVAADVEDIIRPVILSGADGAAFAHCHPSGVAEPSDADRDLTIAIKKSMEIACPNIKFLDHLVITPSEAYSFADNGWSADGKVVKG